MIQPGYRIVVDALIRAGTDTMFGVMGVGNLNIVTDLDRRPDMHYYAARHEAAAVNMADGFARSTGRLGLATVTQGPGFTNVLTALTSAARHRSPMLLLTGSVSRHSNQFIDQETLVAPTGADYADLGSDGWAEGIAAAIRTARGERRPVVVILPSGAQEREMEAYEPPVEPAQQSLPGLPGDAALDEAVDRLASAHCPVVLAGRGAVRAGAIETLAALADRSGALLATTLQAKSAFDGHPFSLGIAGGFASQLGQRELCEADCVVAFGASLNPWTTERGHMFPKAAFVHCDVDPTVIGSYTPVDVQLRGDARAVAAALLSRLDEREVASTVRGGNLRDRIAAFGSRSDFVETHCGDRLDPRSVSVTLNDVLPMPRTVVLDGGHFVGFPAMYLRLDEPGDLLFTMGFSAIGMGLGTAIGAAIGQPGRPVVALIGDGGLMQCIADLDTAVRYGVRVVVVVYDDAAYGAEIHHLRHRALAEGAARFANPSFVAVAQALGAHAEHAHSLEELATHVTAAVRRDGPALVEVPINGDVLSRWFAHTMGEQPTP
jgi:thiamine pyrophosphate-dependent acetolactate synthase large subunit-like protein